MKSLTLLGASAALIAACGGGGGGPNLPRAPIAESGSDIPVAATQDADAAFDFVNGVAASKSETAEPLVAGDARLATTDTGEPRPL